MADGLSSVNSIGSASIRAEAKNGDFRRVSQQYPEVYEAFLISGQADPKGIDYNNYKIMQGFSSGNVNQKQGETKIEEGKTKPEGGKTLLPDVFTKPEQLFENPLKNIFACEA